MPLRQSIQIIQLLSPAWYFQLCSSSLPAFQKDPSMTRHGYRPLAAIISKQYPHLRPTRAKFLISSSFHLYFIPLQNIPRRYPGPNKFDVPPSAGLYSPRSMSTDSHSSMYRMPHQIRKYIVLFMPSFFLDGWQLLQQSPASPSDSPHPVTSSS